MPRDGKALVQRLHRITLYPQTMQRELNDRELNDRELNNRELNEYKTGQVEETRAAITSLHHLPTR